MQIIDFHTHVFPDNIAAHAVETLSAKAKIKPSCDGTVTSLIESMNRAGIILSVNMPVATKAEQVLSINKWCKTIRSNRLISFAAWHPQIQDLNQLCEIRKNRFPGIKLHPEFQNFSPDESDLHKLWQSCVENDLLVFFHAGADFAFSPPFRSDPAKFAKLHYSFPKLKMILAHFGSWKMWDELEKYLIGSDVILETSFTLDFIENERFVNLCRRHGINKIIFGTDCPWEDQAIQVQKFLSLPFTEEEKKCILFSNAKRLLKDFLDEDLEEADTIR